MPKAAASNSRLQRQLSELQSRLFEAEDTLNAIRSGSVDALVVHTPRGEQLFTLKGADQTYRALVEAMNEGALTLRDRIVSYCNSRFAEMIRTPMEKIFGASIFDLVQSDEFPRLLRRVRQGQPDRGTIEAVLRTAEGGRLPVRLSASRFHSEGHAMVCLVVTDITERKMAERALQELSQRIINAQEQERQRVARDLHDGVNQLLSSAQYRLNSMSHSNNGGPAAEHVRPVQQLIEKAIHEVKAISRNLRPGELDDLGLVSALRSLVQESERRSGIPATFKGNTEKCPQTMSKETEVALYRIAQEALANVEKHSRATRMELKFACSRTHASLQIRDNGRGIWRRRKSEKKSGLGLKNMNERAALLGGQLTVESAPEKGTRISLRLPLGNSPRTG